MTLKIWYKEHQMFDIEVYITQTDKYDNGVYKYYTEVKPYLLSEGIAYYVYETLDDVLESKLKEFLRDIDVIESLRQTLWEGAPDFDWRNTPLDCNEADRRMCRVHLPKFKEMIKEFCDKYDLSLSED